MFKTFTWRDYYSTTVNYFLWCSWVTPLSLTLTQLLHALLPKPQSGVDFAWGYGEVILAVLVGHGHGLSEPEEPRPEPIDVEAEPIGEDPGHSGEAESPPKDGDAEAIEGELVEKPPTAAPPPSPPRKKPYFYAANPDDPERQTFRRVNIAEFEYWAEKLPEDHEDLDTVAALCAMEFARTHQQAKESLGGVAILESLPKLKHLFVNLWHLDTARRNTIDRGLRFVPQRVMATMDEEITRYLTPTEVAQEIPSAQAIGIFIRRLKQKLCPETLEKNQDESGNVRPRERGLRFRYDRSDGTAELRVRAEVHEIMALERAVHKRLAHQERKAIQAKEGVHGPSEDLMVFWKRREGFLEKIREVAREQNISETLATEMAEKTLLTMRLHAFPRPEISVINPLDAFLSLIWDNVKVNVTLNTYGPPDGQPKYLERDFYLRVVQQKAMAKLVNKVRDLTNIPELILDCHDPNEAQRAFVFGRDGTCRAPGCQCAAELCDIDHVIEYDDDGPTTIGNMMSLCRRHHCQKTDGRMRAYMRHDGTAIFTYPNGVQVTTRPEGPLAEPTGSHWGITWGKYRQRPD